MFCLRLRVVPPFLFSVCAFSSSNLFTLIVEFFARLDVTRIRHVLRMTSLSKSSRRRRSAITIGSNGGGVNSSSNSHPLSHSNSRRLPFYPSSKIKSSVAWRMLASKPVRRQFAWGRLVEAVSSSARSWLARPTLLL